MSDHSRSSGWLYVSLALSLALLAQQWGHEDELEMETKKLKMSFQRSVYLSALSSCMSGAAFTWEDPETGVLRMAFCDVHAVPLRGERK